jgi:hypothetical protein
MTHIMRGGVEEPIRSKSYDEQNCSTERNGSKSGSDCRPGRFGYLSIKSRDSLRHGDSGMNFFHLRHPRFANGQVYLARRNTANASRTDFTPLRPGVHAP